MNITTVIINSGGTALKINACDFDAETQELWEGEAPTPVDLEAELEPGELADDDVENDVKVTHKGGGRWFVTVNDQSVHEGTLTKEEAQALAAEY
jgi:hypothetical protein